MYRLVAARQLADVMPTESYTGQTIDQLLTYMARQGLRFAPADPNGDAAYDMVFRQMTDYYTSLHGLAMAVEQNDRKLANFDAEAGQLMDVRNRDTLAALKEVLEAGPKCDPLVKFRDVAECIAAIKDTLFPPDDSGSLPRRRLPPAIRWDPRLPSNRATRFAKTTWASASGAVMSPAWKVKGIG